jgi:predicted GIY-YIG superfamily endonuclease
MAWKVYIAEAKNKRYYTGITENPTGRLLRHNSGKGSHFAIQNGPLKIVYVSNDFGNKSLARRREIQIKGWTRSKKQKLISGEWE